MAARASESPETTAQLVELLGYIQDCRDCAMFDLREKSRTTAEYVLFLMEHAHLNCKFKKVLPLNTGLCCVTIDLYQG